MRKTPSIELTARRVLLGLAVLMTVASSISCTDEDKNADRDEYIDVYADPFLRGNPVSTLIFDVSGGEQTVYVRSNIDFTAYWENDGTTQWAKVTNDNGRDSRTGFRTVTLSVDPISSSSVSYAKRTGTLLFKAVDGSIFYNVYVKCNQGSTQRLGTDFSWLSYGTADPGELDGTLMEDWTTAQKNYNWTSTVGTGAEHAYCYGRRGYIQLGDSNGHGADIITPTTSALYQDSLLVVSFNAVAYVAGKTGQLDDNRLTIEVTGGGVIEDYADENGTSIQFAVPYYDLYDVDFPTGMWVGTNYLVFIQSTEASSINAATHIRFQSGSLNETGEANCRIFLDNIYVYTVGENEENYFRENGGSGIDYILGAQ